MAAWGVLSDFCSAICWIANVIIAILLLSYMYGYWEIQKIRIQTDLASESLNSVNINTVQLIFALGYKCTATGQNFVDLIVHGS